MEKNPELVSRFPLQLQWSRTYQDSDETFLARDPARFGEHYVANMFRVRYVKGTEAWTWQCLAPGAATRIDPVRLKGLKQTPREAAYEAEQRYGEYLGLITPDELVSHVNSADAVERGHANWARQNWNREGKP
jgi:hypothetical protein